MENKLNLVEILKDCPKGTKLWSPICGECIFQYINTSLVFPIVCFAEDKYGEKMRVSFNQDGYFFADNKCTLFPSKENRDWTTFKAPKKHKKVLRVDDDDIINIVWKQISIVITVNKLRDMFL